MRKEHPDLFKNSYLVLRDFQFKEGMDGYPLSKISFFIILGTGTYLKLGRLEYLVI